METCSCRVYRRWRTCYRGNKSEEWKAYHFRQSQYFYKLWNVQIQNVAWAFNHHTWKLLLKIFYLYQLVTRVTDLNEQKMTKMLPTYPCIRVFPWKMPWCLLKLQRNFPKEYHTIIPVHPWIKIWWNHECSLIVAYTFRPLKRNHFTGLVAESLKVVLKIQEGVCHHCEFLPVGKGSCYVWWGFKRWSGPWLMQLMHKI